MKNYTLICLFGSFLSLFSCKTSKEVFWVSGIKTTCSGGAGKMECLNTYMGDNPDLATWSSFYSPIEGFAFQEGIMQKILVKKHTVHNPPADASTYRYVFKKDLSTRVDNRMALNGDWLVETLNGQRIPDISLIPIITINIKDMMMNGNNGCNLFTGKIQNVNAQNITLGPLVNTQKMCVDMNVPTLFNKLMTEVTSYSVVGDNLTFYNSSMQEIVVCKKSRINPSYAALHKEWILVQYHGNPLNRMVTPPTMKMDISAMQVSGSNGCNTYNGRIVNLTNRSLNIESLASNLMKCRDMKIPEAYDDALAKTMSYQIKNGMLIFYDSDGKESLAFISK